MAAAKRQITVDPKISRPANIKEARRLIEQTFAAQPFGGWSSLEQFAYFNQIGVAGMFAPDDVRKIIEDLERSKMILFED